MKLKRLAVATGLLLAALVAAIGLALHFMDLRPLAAGLAASIEAGTGREVRYGEIVVRLLPRPALQVADVRIGNAKWGSQPWLVQVGRMTAELDAVALLSGRLRIARISLADASVFLETGAAGNGNWLMTPAQGGSAAGPMSIEIDTIEVRSLAFTHRDGNTGRAIQGLLDSGQISIPAGSGRMRLRMRATVAGNGMEVNGTLGTLAALVANGTQYPVDLEGKTGSASASVRGTLDDPLRLDGLNLALRVQSPEFAELAALSGAKLAPLGPLRGAAQLTGAIAAPVLSGIEVDIGAPERTGIKVRGQASGRVLPGGDYAWQSNGLDVTVQGTQFRDLAAWVGRPLPALGRYSIAAHVTGTPAAPSASAINIATGGRGVPEISVHGSVTDLRAASGIDLKVALAAAGWWQIDAAGGVRLPPLRASARLRDAREGYRVDDLDLKIAGSTLSASLQVVRAGPRLRIAGKVASPLIDLMHLPPADTRASAPAAKAGAPDSADHWKLADVDLELAVGRLVFPDGRELASGSGRIALVDGQLKAGALQATIGGAKVKLDGGVYEPQRLAGIELAIALQGGELADLFGFFGGSIAPVGPYQGRAQLRGSRDAPALAGIDATAGRPGQRVRVQGRIDDAAGRRGIALAVSANINDSVAAGRLFGIDLPRLPALRATASLAGPEGGYVVDDLKLALGRTSLEGRVVVAPGGERPHITAKLGGPLLDLSELPAVKAKPDGASPLLAADVDADIRFERVVLPDRRALVSVGGGVRLAAGALALSKFGVAVPGASATVDGSIKDPRALTGLDLMVNAEVTRGAGLAEFAGQKTLDLPPLTASGKLTDVPGGYALSSLRVAHAAATMAGDLTLTRGAKRYKVSGAVSMPLWDLSRPDPPAGQPGSARPNAGGNKSAENAQLPFDGLRAFDADLALRVDALKYGAGPPLGPLLVKAVLDVGNLKVDPAQLGIGPGRTLTASATLDAGKMAWSVRGEGTGFDLGELLERFGRPGLLSGGSTDFAIQLQARGKSVPAILESLSGEARAKVDAFRVHNFAVNLRGGAVMRLFSLANPFHKSDPHTDVKCIAMRLPIRGGVVTSERNLALETAKFNVVGSGSVNLRTGALDAVLIPFDSTASLSAVRSLVRLGGTLAEPKASLDASGALTSVGAAIALPGAGLLVIDVLRRKAMADPHPCATALK